MSNKLNTKNIKFIFFDVGKVLVKKITTYEEDSAKELGVTLEKFEEIHYGLIDEQDEETKNAFDDMNTMDKMTAYVNNFHGKICEKLGITATDELLQKLLTFRYGNYEVKSGVVESLEILSKKYKLGILSNAFVSRRYVELPSLGLDKYFDPIIISFEVGAHKPDSKIYEIALDKISECFTPDQVLFIDDKVENLVAAEKAGIANVVLMLNKEDSDDFVKVNNLPVLIKILENKQ